eukprot:2170906-Rhodomonas_salina.1
MVISNALLWAEPADILSPGKGFSSPDPVREKWTGVAISRVGSRTCVLRVADSNLRLRPRIHYAMSGSDIAYAVASPHPPCHSAVRAPGADTYVPPRLLATPRTVRCDALMRALAMPCPAATYRMLGSAYALAMQCPVLT